MYTIFYYAQLVYIYYMFVHVLYIDVPCLLVFLCIIFFLELVKVTGFPDDWLHVGIA